MREIGGERDGSQLAVQTEFDLVALHRGERRHVQFAADHMEVGMKACQQAAQEGQIGFVPLRPITDDPGQTVDDRRQGVFARHLAHHVGDVHRLEQPALACQARRLQGVLGVHHQLGRGVLREFGHQRGDPAAKDFRRRVVGRPRRRR